jgi:hypothetical protein
MSTNRKDHQTRGPCAGPAGYRKYGLCSLASKDYLLNRGTKLSKALPPDTIDGRPADVTVLIFGIVELLLQHCL